jgi:hypothetical protein
MKRAMHKDHKDLVRRKIQQLRDYYAEIGEDITVDYEENFGNPDLEAEVQ